MQKYKALGSDLFQVDRLKDSAGEVWYKAKSVVEALGFTNAAVTLRRYAKDDPKKFQVGVGGKSFYISRRDVMRLAMRSDSPEAEIFHEWILDVAEAVFDDGAYISPLITREQGDAAKLKIDRILSAPDPWERLVSSEMLSIIHGFYGQHCGQSFWWGHIYSWMNADERAKLDRLNPICPIKMQRETRIHQWITTEAETKERLRVRIIQVLAILESATSRVDFETRANRLGGKNQLELSF